MAPRTSLKRLANAAETRRKIHGKTTQNVQTKNLMSVYQEETIQKIVQHLKDNPDEILPTYAHLTSETIRSKGSDSTDAPEWHDTYRYWRQIPKYFFASLTSDLGSKWGLDMRTIDLVDAASKTAVRELATFIFGVRADTKFPRSLLVESVMMAFLKERAVVLGERAKLVKRGISSSYEIDWLAIGVYRFKWDTESTRVTNISLLGKASNEEMVEVPPSMVINSGWEVKANYDDVAASVSDPSGFAKPFLRDFWKGRMQEHFAPFDPASVKASADLLHSQWLRLQDEAKVADPSCLRTFKENQAQAARAKRRAAPKQSCAVKLRVTIAASSTS